MLAAVATAAVWVVVWFGWLNLQARALVSHIHDHGPLPRTAAPSPSSHIDPRLSGVAATLAGREVEVRCWSVGDWRRIDGERAEIDDDPTSGGLRSAFTSYDRKRINLGTLVCADLAHSLQGVYSGYESWSDLSWAVKLLGHEAMHVHGIGDEATAECYAMQLIPRTARLLGLSNEEGRYLADFFWDEWYPVLDSGYRSTECRNDGELDRNPETDLWP